MKRLTSLLRALVFPVTLVAVLVAGRLSEHYSPDAPDYWHTLVGVAFGVTATLTLCIALPYYLDSAPLRGGWYRVDDPDGVLGLNASAIVWRPWWSARKQAHTASPAEIRRTKRLHPGWTETIETRLRK